MTPDIISPSKGINKIARPMNKAKNTFVDWLKKSNATDIDGLDDETYDEEWDYYMLISGFVGDDLYSATFMVWQGKESIDYSDEDKRYSRLTIDEFLKLLI
ncbi:hypothetical protein [Leeuwenhoekiella sp. MAR_2009_132]|uniref:hypothetical protein n=1 Tax=Leeuwenhoekiella sp. MAR_2009_132 TaxID=1392489 RepID=UPI0004918CB3|nr:hypothetical protein [Leeuwenhoekiella sp. MAR_2009_132]